MERNSSGALRAPGAFGAIGTSDHHAILSSCLLCITRVCSLAAVLRPSGCNCGEHHDEATSAASSAPQALICSYYHRRCIRIMCRVTALTTTVTLGSIASRPRNCRDWRRSWACIHDRGIVKVPIMFKFA